MEQPELDLGFQYNQNAIKFQYDFFNDDVDITPLMDGIYKIPQQLFEDLKSNKPIVFFMNPPYATANNAGAKGTSKERVAKTKINKLMIKEGYGKSAQQLYAQFFYRVFKLKRDFNLDNVVIAFFSKPSYYVSGDYFAKFQNSLFNQFEFLDVNLFNAGEFSDVSADWGITFSILKSSDSAIKKDSYTLNLEESINGNIETFGKHTFYIFLKKNHAQNELENRF